MNNHCAWFEKAYDTEKIVNRFLIIPTKNLPYHADFSHDVKIIREKGLNRLRKNVQRFIDHLHKYHLSEIDDVTLEGLLEENHLNIKSLRNEYCEEYKNQ